MRVRVEHSATLRIMSDVHSPAEISEALGVRPSETAHSADWQLEASAHGNEASLEELIRAVTGPLLEVADKLALLASQRATVELHLTRDLLGPGVGALCFMLDAPVIKLLGVVGAEVWVDEYDEVGWEQRA